MPPQTSADLSVMPLLLLCSMSDVLLKHFFTPLLCVFLFLQSQVAEKGRELKELRDTLAVIVKEKEKLEGVSKSYHFLLYRLLPL